MVDANGRHFGMVTTVVGETAYVAPTTKVSEAVERKLDWDTHREIDHPLSTQFIKEITDEVVLTIEWKQAPQPDSDGY